MNKFEMVMKYKLHWQILIKQQIMSKFNKKLTITLPENQVFTNENESPSVHESVAHEKEGGLLQFPQFRDGGDSQFGDVRNQIQNSKLNFVEFEEFHINRYETKDKIKTEEDKKSPRNKKNVIIDVPGRDEEGGEQRKFKGSKISDNYALLYDQDKYKQPPAPSKGSKHSKVFIFPTTPIKKQEKAKEKEKSENEPIESLKKTFDRERQEFYKEKSKLEKELLIKNGQIEMLHKLLTENFTSNYNHLRHDKGNRNLPDFNHHQYETIILQKDVQITQLLQKISQLNNILSKKNEDLGKKILQVNVLQASVESLRNQIYIYEKKDHNQKLTKKLYELHKEKEMDKSQEKSQPKQQGLQCNCTFEQHNKQFGLKGLESLHKRIEMVRMNRMEFDSRNKIKSDTMYSQSTKSRPKGSFDFKGKTYDINNFNKTRMF